MKSNGSSLKTRVEQSVVDYACSLRSERRKALLKVLIEYVPEKHRDIALTCPDHYKRLFLSCAEDVIRNDEKENFRIAIAALGDGSDWKKGFNDCTFEQVQMTIARHTCLSLVTQKSFDMAQQFLRRCQPPATAARATASSSISSNSLSSSICLRKPFTSSTVRVTPFSAAMSTIR